MALRLPARIRFALNLLGLSVGLAVSFASGASEWTLVPETNPFGGKSYGLPSQTPLHLLWKNGGAGEGGDRLRTAAIAVPPGMLASAAFESIDGHSAATETWPLLSISAPARFRDLYVASLSLDPRRASAPGSTGKQGSGLISSARIRITFRAAPAPAPTRAAFPPPADNPSEKFLQSWILNYAQSRNLRNTPAPNPKTAAAARTPAFGASALAKTATQSNAATLASAAAQGPSPSASLPKIRLLVQTKQDNIEFLSFDAMKGAGLPLGDIDPRFMHLYQDGLEVPIYISGENDGHWDPGDYIEFIGRRPHGTNSYNSLFTETTTFILTWEGGRLGLRAPAVPVASRTGGIIPATPEGAKAAQPFQVHDHQEEDLDILHVGSTSAEDIVDLGARVQESELTDFWFWKRMGAEKDAMDLPFSSDFAPFSPADSKGPAAAAGSSLHVTVNLKGVTNNPKADPDHHLKFILNGSDISLVGGTNHDAIWEGQDSYTWISPPVNPNILKQGKNTLVIQKVNDLKTTDGQVVDVQDAYVNYVELDYPALYAAFGDKLRFSNAFGDSLGLRLFTLTGFTTDDISLWDVQGRKLVNFRAEPQAGSYQVNFLDTLVGPSNYVAVSSANRETPAIRLDTLDDLLNPSQGADYLVVTKKELFGSALDSLLDFHRKQGLRCRVVRADHIYQAFGDGSMDPADIRRFAIYAYQNWTRPAPTYLLLVGDATQGYEKKAAGTTVVPTHLVNIRGWGVAANDDFFGKVSGEDDLSDLFVGRIPVNTPEDLSKVVRKTLALQTQRPQGHWSNKTFLISGFESSFTAVNGKLQGIAAANDRQYSRLDLFPGSPHYKSVATNADFFNQLDSAFNLVSFVGHGGGAVWSDAGVLTLQALQEGKLQGDYPIPLVASITCLTGFFEDMSAPSLGEEMIRLDKSGAAGFYGAAGYISNLAGEALSTEVLQAAAGNAYGTIGAIVTQAETMVKLRTGDAFLPILAEFNLLGDPALSLSFPKQEGELALDPQTLSGASSLGIKGGKLALDQGNGVVTVFLGDSAESDTPVSVSGAAFSAQRTFTSATGPVQNGKVVAHYWNDKEARVASAPFSTLDWLIDSVAIEPASAAPGDSVMVRFKFGTAYGKIAFSGGVAAYVVGADPATGGAAPLFPGENVCALKTDDNVHFVTTSKIRLDPPQTDLSAPKVFLAFRLSVQVVDNQGQIVKNISDLSSRIYSLPLSETARLEFPENAFRLPIQDKLGVWISFHNRGLAAASGFKLALLRDADSPAPVADTVSYAGSLAFGARDSLFFSLADSMLNGKRLRAILVPAKEGQLAAQSNAQDTVFHVLTSTFSSGTDTLKLDTAGAYLSLPTGATKPMRLFVTTESVASLPPHLSPAVGGLPFNAYRVESPEFSDGGNVLIAQRPPTPATPKAAAQALGKIAAPHPYWHYRELTGQTWLKLDTVSGAAWGGLGFRSGVYYPLLNSDATGPLVQFSSRGQVLLQDDYVPLRTPIDVTIRDGQGVDLIRHPPALISREQSLDSANHAQESGTLFPTMTRINFLPKHASDRDSLEVTAFDVSGNVTRKSLVYRLGDDLTIRDLGSYPNPFADTATFVFSLTDYCDKVDLKVYSRAGRLVRALQETNVVGYQEVVWDGISDRGNQIANGLYFLKVTAKAGSKETSRIFKLFKKQRK